MQIVILAIIYYYPPIYTTTVRYYVLCHKDLYKLLDLYKYYITIRRLVGMMDPKTQEYHHLSRGKPKNNE